MGRLRISARRTSSTAEEEEPCCELSTTTTCSGSLSFRDSATKYLHLMLTSLRLLKGPNKRASSEAGFARGGRVGGKDRWDSGRALVVREAAEVKSALSSFEYMGGREDSTAGIILGGIGALGSLRIDY